MRNESTTREHHSGSRLTPLDRNSELAPWRRATKLERCRLYWIPVNGYPMPAAQRAWLRTFFDRFSEALAAEFGLEEESFLQYKVIHPDLVEECLRRSEDYLPITGLGRRPGDEIPKCPTPEEMARVTKAGGYDIRDYLADYCYWFMDRAHTDQRESFFGVGGAVYAWLKPQASRELPPIPAMPGLAKSKHNQYFNLERLFQGASRLTQPFLANSKKAFGAGLEKDPQYPGLPFVIPLLDTGDFFKLPDEEIDKLFGVFDVYAGESKSDNGVLIAAKQDLDDVLIETTRALFADGFEYPLGGL